MPETMKLVGSLAEAFVRVERDLALLHGVGYWSQEEWVSLDALIHKGEYLFTNGPGMSLIDMDSPTLVHGSVREKCDGMADGMDDLLMLNDDCETSSGSNSQMPYLPYQGSGTTTHVGEDEKSISMNPPVQESRELQVVSRCHSISPPVDDEQLRAMHHFAQEWRSIQAELKKKIMAPSSSATRVVEEEERPTSTDLYALTKLETTRAVDEEERSTLADLHALDKLETARAGKKEEEEQSALTNSPALGNTEKARATYDLQPDVPTPYALRNSKTRLNPRSQTPTPSEQLPPMPAILSKYAPQTSKPWRDDEAVPNIRMISYKTNNSWSSKNVKVLHIQRGDMMEVYKFCSGHKFMAKNLRTGETGQIHEEIFFPVAWAEVLGVLELYRKRAATSDASNDTYAYNQLSRCPPKTRPLHSSEHYPERQRGDKSLTCWFWSTLGECSLPEHVCRFAHHNTGKLANEPRKKFRKDKLVKSDTSEHGDRRGEDYGSARDGNSQRRRFDDWRPRDEGQEVPDW